MLLCWRMRLLLHFFLLILYAHVCLLSSNLYTCMLPAVWCLSVWQSIGSPPAFNLVEMGPGKGTLMRDILKATKVCFLRKSMCRLRR